MAISLGAICTDGSSREPLSGYLGYAHFLAYNTSGAGFSCLAVLPLPRQVLTAGMLAS